MPKKKIELPADLYDFLYMQGLAYGGIGAGLYWETKCMEDDVISLPFCIHGCARDATDPTEQSTRLEQAGLTVDVNDLFVRRYNKSRGRLKRDGRVPVKDYFEGLNIQRLDD